MAAAAPATRPAMAPEEGRRRRRPREPLPEPEPGRASEARARQWALWGRARSLGRRLRALQARQVERHVRQQLAGLGRGQGQGGRPTTRPPLGAQAPSGVPPLGSELRQLAASATARLRAAQRACDSDATDSASLASSSSSGASSAAASSSSSSSSSDSESADPPPPPRPFDAGRRLAERQWAVERAAIICRWTWLQAQVSDLEYRIRQQTDVYKQLRANKGPVVLDDLQRGNTMKQQSQQSSAAVMNSRKHLKVPVGDKPCQLSPCIPSYLLQNAEKQNSHLAQSFRNLVCRNPSCTSINGSPEPPKACKPPPQVNGISNCFSTGSTSNSQDGGVNADRILRKSKQLNNSLPAATAAAAFDTSCVAARIRPICRYRKRRLVRVSAVSHLSRKLQRPLSLKCNCEHPNSCILCDCKAPVQTINPEMMSLQERVALLDSGFHPILSFSHGSPLHLHFEALLREDHRLYHRLKNPKALHCGLKDLTNNIGSSPFSASDSPLKGSADHPQSHKPSALRSVSSLCLENTPAPPHSPAAGSSALQPAKKKKVECCYDINNIVIPVSMAAATRVEKLQYKEIITPSWRVVNTEDLKNFGEIDSELEDTSDETYLNHHQKYEQLERSHWDSWAGTIPHKRGNRSASKPEGQWMAPPGSPEATSPTLNHTPRASSPAGSLSPELPSVAKPLLLKGRGRGSLSLREDTCFFLSEMEDDIQNVQPWEPRTFPLSDAECQALQGPCEVLSKRTSALLQWDSGSYQGLRTNRVNSGASHARELSMRRWPVEADRSKLQKEFVGQPGILPVLLNNR
ncbi:KAT8 regulatory NSL complex subunit 1 [Pogona vitticeps]